MNVTPKSHIIFDNGELVRNQNISQEVKLASKRNILISQRKQSEQRKDFFFTLKLKKIAQQFAQSLQSRRYTNLRLQHLKFFNDKSIFPQQDQKIFSQDKNVDENSFKSNFQCKNFIMFILIKIYTFALNEKWRRKLIKIPVFQPSNQFKLAWDLVNLVANFYFFLFFPLKIAFGFELYSNYSNFVCFCIILSDILITFNTSYYQKGEIIENRLNIISNYISNRFIYDIISLFPFFLNNYVGNNQGNIFSDKYKLLNSLVCLLFFIRISHVTNLKNKLEDRIYQQKQLTYLMQLLNLLIYALYIAHIFACIWIIVARFQISTKKTWMNNFQINENEFLYQYLTSLYFVTITMTTVGYGDIKPENQLEVTFAIAITLITTGVFAYCVNQIGTIVKFWSEEKEKTKQTIQIINNYMSKKNINIDLQQQIREYLEYYLKESTINDNEQEGKIINMLSEPLQKQLMIEANKIALKDSPIFRKNFTDNTIQKTVFLIQELRCTPEEILFYEGDKDDSSIFFVQQGKLELFVDSYDSVGQTKISSLKVFTKGQCVGEQSFFTGQPRETSIRSVDFTTLLMIKRQDFIAILKESPIDYENFCHIKDKILLLKNYENLGNKCLSCTSDYHFVNECPYIHYIPNRHKIIKQNQKPIFQDRDVFPNYLRLQKHNTFTYLRKTQDEAYEIYDRNVQFIEDQEWFDEYQKSELEYNVYCEYEENEENQQNLMNNQQSLKDFKIDEDEPLLKNQNSLSQKAPQFQKSPQQSPTALNDDKLFVKNQSLKSLVQQQNLPVETGEPSYQSSHQSSYYSQNSVKLKENPKEENNQMIKRQGSKKNSITFEKMAQGIERRNTNKKNTNGTIRSSSARPSSHERKNSKRKVSIIRRGAMKHQTINQTLLALQGVENIIMQNKLQSTNQDLFEVMKSFEVYFPHNNIEMIILKLQKKFPHIYIKNKQQQLINKQYSQKKTQGNQTIASNNRMSKMDVLLMKLKNQQENDDDEQEDFDEFNSNRNRKKTDTAHKLDIYKTENEIKQKNFVQKLINLQNQGDNKDQNKDQMTFQKIFNMNLESKQIDIKLQENYEQQENL